MRFPRSSGILLHPTSLPGEHGIGSLGKEAYRFADWLVGAAQRIWQVLPLGPPVWGDSPYASFSAFAGNPLLIDLGQLAARGWLDRRELDTALRFSPDTLDSVAVREFKRPLLAKAARAFARDGLASGRAEFEEFTAREAAWLDDYALFMAVKEANGGAVWSDWDRDIACREPVALERWSRRLAEEVLAQKFIQWVFFDQWQALREYCHARNLRIMGDLPIYVAHDSADVWAHRDLFELDGSGRPTCVSGVPPDYFSETGQLWGNPIYRWEEMARRGFEWWIARLRATFEMVDMVRIDHFRGFEAYWSVPAGERTAMKGEWIEAPGERLFERAESVLGRLPLVAENLGVITPKVEALRERFGLPGMSILQFAFGKDPQGPGFRPHNFERHHVAYTGTHDNDTTMGWWTGGTGETTRTERDVQEEREFTRKYLGSDGDQIHWVFIRTLLASVADTVLFPLQDVLGLGSEARMNIPARTGGNWRWRFRWEMVTPSMQSRLKEMTRLYDR